FLALRQGVEQREHAAHHLYGRAGQFRFIHRVSLRDRPFWKVGRRADPRNNPLVRGELSQRASGICPRWEPPAAPSLYRLTMRNLEDLRRRSPTPARFLRALITVGSLLGALPMAVAAGAAAMPAAASASMGSAADGAAATA